MAAAPASLMDRFKSPAPLACKATTRRSLAGVAIEAKRRKGMTRGRPAHLLKDSADDSTSHANGGAVRGGSERTGEIDDHVGDFVSACETLQQRGRTNILEEFFFESGGVRTFLRTHLRDESFGALRSSWPNERAVDGDACAGDCFGKTASDGDLRGLGHAVVNHFRWNLHGGLAGDENNPAPIFFAHAREIMTREAHAAHNVGFEEAHPIFVGNFFEGFWFEDAHVIDQDVHGLDRLDQFRATVSIGNVGGNAGDIGAGMSFSNFGNGGIYTFLRSSIHHYRRAFCGQSSRCGKTDSGCGAGYQCFLAFEL